MSDTLTLNPEHTGEAVDPTADPAEVASPEVSRWRTGNAIRVGVSAALATTLMVGAGAYGIHQLTNGEELHSAPAAEDSSPAPVVIPSPRKPIDQWGGEPQEPKAASTTVTATITIDTGIPKKK